MLADGLHIRDTSDHPTSWVTLQTEGVRYIIYDRHSTVARHYGAELGREPQHNMPRALLTWWYECLFFLERQVYRTTNLKIGHPAAQRRQPKAMTQSVYLGSWISPKGCGIRNRLWAVVFGRVYLSMDVCVRFSNPWSWCMGAQV